MLQDILNLEGVAVLSKNQQKNVNGGGNLQVRNLKPTNRFTEYNGGVVACECTWEYSYDGKNWKTNTGACPTGEYQYSCV